MKRLIAIGDIHGQLYKLDNLLEKVAPNYRDQLVFLGDYVDRGPDSCGVIERLIKLKEHYKETVFLRGNHEQMFLDALVSVGIISGRRLRQSSPKFASMFTISDIQLFLGSRAGGKDTLISYGLKDLSPSIPTQHIDFLRGTLLWWQYAQFIFAHASYGPDFTKTQDPFHLLWNRELKPLSDNKILVVGHTPKEFPLFDSGIYMLDTGSWGHGPLTACDVISKKVWQSDF